MRNEDDAVGRGARPLAAAPEPRWDLSPGALNSVATYPLRKVAQPFPDLYLDNRFAQAVDCWKQVW